MFQFIVAEGCGTVATFCDIGAAICYHMSGNQLKRNFALFGVGLDLISGAACYFKPELKTGYNIAAKCFINLVP